MAPRSFRLAAAVLPLVALAVAACSSAPPSDPESFPTEPDTQKNVVHRGAGAGADPSGNDPIVASCNDTCTDGERRCAANGAGLEVCVHDASGCLAFIKSACADGGLCTTASLDHCAGKCTGVACPQMDTLRCSGTNLERCGLSNGCLEWQPDEDCAAKNQVCTGSACAAKCDSNCTTSGAKRCVSGTSSYETCKEVQPGCLRWQGTKACGAGMACTGAGTCSCVNECTPDSNACTNPTQFKSCVKNANGCYAWSAPKGCINPTTPGCYVYPKACFGTCTNTCSPEGSTGCTGPYSYAKCVRGLDGCLVNETGSCKTSDVCFYSSSVCANGY